jgi:hypothetical protein
VRQGAAEDGEAASMVGEGETEASGAETDNAEVAPTKGVAETSEPDDEPVLIGMLGCASTLAAETASLLSVGTGIGGGTGIAGPTPERVAKLEAVTGEDDGEPNGTPKSNDSLSRSSLSSASCLAASEAALSGVCSLESEREVFRSGFGGGVVGPCMVRAPAQAAAACNQLYTHSKGFCSV